jgi:hypothetical protein
LGGPLEVRSGGREVPLSAAGAGQEEVGLGLVGVRDQVVAEERLGAGRVVIRKGRPGLPPEPFVPQVGIGPGGAAETATAVRPAKTSRRRARGLRTGGPPPVEPVRDRGVADMRQPRREATPSADTWLQANQELRPPGCSRVPCGVVSPWMMCQ